MQEPRGYTLVPTDELDAMQATAQTDDELTVSIEALREYRHRQAEPSRKLVSEALIMRFAQELLRRAKRQHGT